MKPKLTLNLLKKEASTFAALEISHEESRLYGVTDGKAVGTYLEHKFNSITSMNSAIRHQELIFLAWVLI